MLIERHKIVDKGQVNNINYWIVKNGNSLAEWYCAYIEKPNGLAEDEWEKIGFEPHGDITYSDHREEFDAYVWGWDYNHLDDYDEENMTTKLAKLDTEKAVEHIRKDVKEYVDKLCKYISYESI